VDSPLILSGMTHFFLSTFTEGWCILAVIGIIYEKLDVQEVPYHIQRSWLVAPVVLGVPLMFPFGMPVHLLTNQLLIAASFGSLVVAMGLAVNLWILSRYSAESIPWWWIVVLNMLAAKILLQFGASVLPFNFWLGEHGLRVFYLHIVLLGFVSLSLFSAWHSMNLNEDKSGLKVFVSAVLLVLLSLLLISGFWPSEWQPGRLLYQIITFAALLPALSAMWEWKIIYKSHQGSA